MSRTTITEYYVLTETDDIDFSVLRLAVDEFNKRAETIEESAVIVEQGLSIDSR